VARERVRDLARKIDAQTLIDRMEDLADAPPSAPTKQGSRVIVTPV
jgi:hypothetical protein